MDGQRGIARLCTEQIINTKDKKKLLVATDQSRNKFRYMDEKGNMKDDIEARTFIEKVSSLYRRLRPKEWSIQKKEWERIHKDIKIPQFGNIYSINDTKNK